MFFFNDLTNTIIETIEVFTDRPVGDGIAPKDPDHMTEADYPYSVVYPGDTTFRLMSGPINNTQGDKGLQYHVVYVAYSREGCERLAERVRDAMAWDNYKDFDGVRIQDVSVSEYGFLDRTTEVRPPVFTIRDSFLFRTTDS